MAKLNYTLEEITNSYSLFKENQVLTATQLNQVVRYFDDQDRLTRTRGIGVGIICGFELNFKQAAGQIQISKGCGITTDGDLVYLDDAILLSKYRVFSDEQAEYPYFTTEAESVQLWELMKADSDIEGLKTLEAWKEKDETGTSISYNDLAVVAYLENYQKEPDTCTELDCDNQGIQVLRDLRFLLIEKSSLNYIIANFDTLFKKYQKLSNVQNQLPIVKIQRVILNSLNTASEATLYESFGDKVNKLRSPLISALEKLFLQYSNLLDPGNTISFTAWNVKLNSGLNLNLKQTTAYFQYRYDWAKDLVNTYLELRQSLQNLEKECCPNPLAFPKHLMVSELILTSHNPEYRHGFYPSPAVSKENESLLKAKFLFSKLDRQILNFNLSTTNEVRITPSALYHGKPAIPYYYHATNVFAQWDFELNKTGREVENLGYFAVDYAGSLNDDTILSPLKYDIDGYDFFRIEGHIGKDYAQTVKDIKSKVSSFGLPIEVQALRLGSLAEQLNLDDYSCYFDDLEVILRAWEVELNCLMKTLARFFSGFKLDVAGTHFDYPTKIVTAAGSMLTAERSAAGTARVFSTENIVPGKELNSLRTSAMPKDVYKLDTTVRDNVIVEDKSLGQVIDVIFKANPSGSDNDVINESTKKIIDQYDTASWDKIQKEVVLDIPLTILAVANDISKYKPGDLKVIEKVDVVTQFETKLNALCKEASRWNSKVNNYFSVAGYKKIGYEEKYLQILGELAQTCCSAEKLTILREEISKRKAEILENTLLAKYAEKHSGLEHLGGVPKGGTFVLVYKDEARASRVSAATARDITAFASVATKAKTANSPVKGSTVRALSLSNFGIAENQHIAGTAGNDVNYEVLTKISDLYREAIGLTKGIIAEDSNLPGFTVVADFCLPYICCSDCPPMSFIIPKERVSLRLPVEFICFGEGTEVLPIEVFPIDGIVAADKGSEAVVKKEDGKYVFDASKLATDLYGQTIHFTVNNQQTETTLIVFQQVEAAFEVPATNIMCFPEKGLGIVKFVNNTLLLPNLKIDYQWDFGDGTAGNERFDRDPVHEYQLKDIQGKQPLTVTLKVTNGRCPSFATQQLSLCEIATDSCRESTISTMAKLGQKIQNYDPKTFGDHVTLLKTTTELSNTIQELGTSAFESDKQTELLKNLISLNRETAKAIDNIDNRTIMIALAVLYLDQIMLILLLVGCGLTEESFSKDMIGYFGKEVIEKIKIYLEKIKEILESDFSSMLSEYINGSPKIPDKFMEILKKLLDMFKR